MTKKKQSFEENITEANKIIEQLEKGDLPLEEAMNGYKKGIELIQQAHELLAEAEDEFTSLVRSLEQADAQAQTGSEDEV